MHVPSPKCARDAFQQSTASHYRTLIFSKNTFDGRQTTTKGVQMTINNLMDKRTVERRKKIKNKIQTIFGSRVSHYLSSVLTVLDPEGRVRTSERIIQHSTTGMMTDPMPNQLQVLLTFLLMSTQVAISPSSLTMPSSSTG